MEPQSRLAKACVVLAVLAFPIAFTVTWALTHR